MQGYSPISQLKGMIEQRRVADATLMRIGTVALSGCPMVWVVGRAWPAGPPAPPVGQLYELIQTLYVGAVTTGTTRTNKVSRNGQVSLPASVRSRWKTDTVVTVDMGSYVLIRPMPDDPVGSVIGKYRDRGIDSERLREETRRDETRRDEARRGLRLGRGAASA